MDSLGIVIAGSNTTLLDAKGQDPTFRWASVSSVSPLRVRLDGSPTPLDSEPVTLVPGLHVDDRVWVQIIERRALILGVGQGSLTDDGLPALPWRAVYVETWDNLNGWTSTNGFETPAVSGGKLQGGEIRKDFGLNASIPYRLKIDLSDWEWGQVNNGFFGRKWRVQRTGPISWEIVTYGASGTTTPVTMNTTGQLYAYIYDAGLGSVRFQIGNEIQTVPTDGDANHWGYTFPSHIGANFVVGGFTLEVPDNFMPEVFISGDREADTYVERYDNGLMVTRGQHIFPANANVTQNHPISYPFVFVGEMPDVTITPLTTVPQNLSQGTIDEGLGGVTLVSRRTTSSATVYNWQATGRWK